MAGSIKYFVYTDNAGNDWALKRDESNTEAVNGGTQDYPDAAVTPPPQFEIPRNVTPRYARYVSADTTVSRTIVCLTQTIANGLAANVGSFTDVVSGKVVFLKEVVGERKVNPMGIDTGLTDGDLS